MTPSQKNQTLSLSKLRVVQSTDKHLEYVDAHTHRYRMDDPDPVSANPQFLTYQMLLFDAERRGRESSRLLLLPASPEDVRHGLDGSRRDFGLVMPYLPVLPTRVLALPLGGHLST